MNIISWLQANWLATAVVILAVDNYVLGFLPNNPILGEIKSVLSALIGSKKPPV